MNYKIDAGILKRVSQLLLHNTMAIRILALLFVIALLMVSPFGIYSAKGEVAKQEVEGAQPGNVTQLLSKETQPGSGDVQQDTEAAEEPSVQSIKKKYMIIISNAKGYYTFYDLNDKQDGNAAIELTPNDTIMVPLKRLVKLIPELTYKYDSSKKTATIQNTLNGKKITYKKNSKTLSYYSGPKAKASKKTMAYKMYVSDATASVMVPMDTIKWIFQSGKGYGYYSTDGMQKYGYDTMEYSGLIVYQPYKEIEVIPKAANVTGISLTVKVTIPEGFSAVQIVELLVKKGVCASTKELFEVMENYDFSKYSLIAGLEDSDNRCYRLEGYLFPDTYEFYRLSKPENVIGKLLANSEAKLKEEYRLKAQEIGLSMDELITIASLVEKETSDPEIMPVVASVIYNRLKINMKLQLDCSYFYLKRYIWPNIDGDVNRYDSYYDTYKCPALPEGPIANPGLAAIRAALNPADTDYLFFYSDKNGEYHFSVEYVNSRLLEQEAEKEDTE